MILETHRVWTFFFLASANMLAHRYRSRDNSRGLVKNDERRMKMKPSENPGGEQRLVLSVLSQTATTRHRAAQGAVCSPSITPPVAFCLQNNLISPSIIHFAFQPVISTAAGRSPLQWYPGRSPGL